MTQSLTYQQMGTAARGQAYALFAQTMGYVAATAALFALGAWLGRDLTGGAGIIAFIAAFAALIGMRVAARRSAQLTAGLLAAFGLLIGLAVDGRLPRPARLIFGRNELRRPCDRIEGALLLAVSAASLTVLALAALLAGHIYNSQRAAAACLRPTVAILSEPGPVVANASNPTAQVQAQATWLLADGAKRSGLLTASTAPAIDDAGPGLPYRSG
jgi:hypothetical protein